MSRKTSVITVLCFAMVLFLFNGIATAQDINQLKPQYDELLKELSDLRLALGKMSGEDYDANLKIFNEKLAEKNRIKAILEGDLETKKKINAIKKLIKDGNTALKLRRSSEADSKYNQAIADAKALNNPLVNDLIRMSYTNKATIYRGKKNWSKMKESAMGALKIDPNIAKTHYQIAEANVRLGNLAAGEASYIRATELDPKMHSAFYNLGNIYYGQKNYDRAIEVYMGSIKAKSNYDRAYRMLGRSYFEKKDFRSCEMALQKAVEIKDDDWQSHYYLSQSYNKTSKFFEAITEGNNTLKYNKGHGGAYIQIGLAYKAQGEKAKALVSFEKAAKDPKFKDLAEWNIKYYDKGN